MTKIVSNTFNIHNAKQFIESLTEPASDNYYLAFGKHTPYANSDAVVSTPSDTLINGIQSIYNDMIFGKKISSSDVVQCIDKNIWASGTVYDIYDDQDSTLNEKQFFVTVLSGSNYNIFKCLDNNSDGESTVQPSTITTTPVTYTDGYVWKYLYTISGALWSKFATTNYMPVYSNTSIVQTAKDRAVEVILTEFSGSGYNNYNSGTFETDTQIISTTEFKLQGDASVFNDFYTGCVIEFTTGAGQEYKLITNYVVSGANKTITINSPITNDVEVGDTYQIYPRARVYGDGTESNTCIAWAVIDSTASNSVSKVEVLQAGLGYRVPTANVIADESVSVTEQATLRPIVSPIGGHGFNPSDELFGNKVCVSVKVTGSESNNIIASNDFRNVSMILNPEFRSIKLEHNDTDYIFNIGEIVNQYKAIQLTGTVSVNASSNGQLVVGNTTFFEESLDDSDVVLIKDANTTFFSNVLSISSNTSLALVTGLSSNIASANVYLVKTSASGKVVSYSTNTVNITEVTNNFSVGSTVYGVQSSTSITLTDVKNNGRATNNLNTYQQTTRFEGTLTGTFTNDEVVYQEGTYENENLRPTGRLFHVIDDSTDYLYITNERNQFSNTGIIIGNTSGASFTCINKVKGDLIVDSGQVLYINNVEAVSKSNTSAETIKTVLEF